MSNEDKLPVEALPQTTDKFIKVDVLDSPDALTQISDFEQVSKKALKATPFQWNGKELYPFSIDREADWLLFRQEIGKPDLTKVLTGEGLAFLYDAMAIAWFCSHKPEAWIGKTALQIDEMIRDWGNENVTPDRSLELITLVIELFNRAHINKPAVKEKK